MNNNEDGSTIPSVRKRASTTTSIQLSGGSRPLSMLSFLSLAILIVGSNLTLCYAERSDEESLMVPFLQTKPPSQLQDHPSYYYDQQNPAILDRFQSSLQQWQPKERALEQLQKTKAARSSINGNSRATATTNTNTAARPQRMNVRGGRRHHGSARGKQINRALKHHTRTTNHHHAADSTGTATEEEYEMHTVVPMANDTDTHYYNEEEEIQYRASKSGKKSKAKTYSKSSKHNVLGTYEEIDEQYLHIHHDYGAKNSKSSSKSSKSKKGMKGKKGKGHHGRSKGAGGVRYFEANVLLELEDHYVAQLSYLDVQQLETAVMETYNQLSNENCDLQGRQLVAVTTDPTPTSTGYILHLQGECYNCDPANVRVFAHPDDVFDGDMMMLGDMSKGKDKDKKTKEPAPTLFPSFFGGMDIPDSANDTTTMTDTGNATDEDADPMTPEEMMMMMMQMTTDPNVTATVPPAATTDAPANATVAPTAEEPPAAGANTTTARNRGGQQPAAGLLPKKIRTGSKKISRLQRSQDYDEEEEDVFNYGTTAQSRTRYHANEGIRRKLNNHHHHRSLHSAVNRNPEEIEHQQGDNVNRDPEPVKEDRTGHVDPSASLVYPAKKAKTGIKGYREPKGSSTSKSKSQKGYHPVIGCENPNASLTAPTEEEFVLALNHATQSLLAQYNKLSIRSALQVKPLTCDATEEVFDSVLVVQFMGPDPPAESLSPEEIELIAQSILQSYNHLQTTHSCDVPYFREMTALVLRGIAPGPAQGTFLGMFEVHGTCRGVECSDGATFFDPLDDERTRRLLDQVPPRSGFASVLSRSGHAIEYDEGNAHVYQDQCYCPLFIQEFGPPFVSDMEEVLNHVIQDASDAGLIEAVVSVVDIMEVSDDDLVDKDEEEDDVAYEVTPAPAPTEEFESFVIVQFFGQQELVTEPEVNAIEDSMPDIYKNLQDNSFCDPLSRVLTSVILQTVDPGPTPNSFLLGFFWVGTCQGDGCSDNPMFFSPSGQEFIPCSTNKVEGPPVIEDFENDLFSTILALREEGTLDWIDASGDAVEVLPGSTPAPILSPGVSSPAPTANPTTAASLARAQMLAATKARNANRDSAPAPKPSEYPTEWPTWIDTDFPTYKLQYGG